MKTIRWLPLMVLLVALSLVTTGCMAARRPAPDVPNTPKQNLPAPGSAPSPNLTPSADDRTVAERVQRTVNEVPDVTKAYVVVVGNTALIGVDINEAQRGPVDEALKQRIANQVRNQEQRISTVYVTADPNLVTRIRRLGDNITEGKPISGLLNEVMEILQKLKPTGSR